jgi:cysteine-rich repeat protein
MSNPMRSLAIAGALVLAVPPVGWSYMEFVPIGGNPNYYAKVLDGLSRDGSTAFIAMAPSLFSAGTRYAVDLATVAVSPAPVPPAIAGVAPLFPIVSATGRFFVFDSPDATLVPNDTNNEYDSFIYDSVADTFERVSVTNGGGQLPRGFFTAAIGVSADGRFVAFESHAPNVVFGDTNLDKPDVFIRDRCLSDGMNVAGCFPTTTMVSFGPAGVQSPDGCYAEAPQSMSDDARFVVFDCFTDVTVFAPGNPCPSPPFPNDPNSCQGVYLRDTCLSNGVFVPGCTPTTELVNRTPTGEFPPDADAQRAVVSGDGSRVAYPSTFNFGVVPNDPAPFGYQVYLFDHPTGTTRRISEPNAPPDSYLTLGISGDGTNVLVKGDDQTFDVVFIWADCAAKAPVCGDGQRVPGCEACDDGNLVDGDGCDSNCQKTGCGNGVVTSGEVCDDGNLTDGDGCDSNCTPTACGNGIRTAGEECDDGNVVDGDGCSSTCTLEPENMMPGGGSSKTDCYSEFLTRPRPAVRFGKLDKGLTCKDDDPACDQGKTTGDHACTFRVEHCFNLTDPRAVDCTSPGVWRIGIQQPRDSDKTTQVEADNRGQVNLAYNNAGAAYGGHCTKPADVVGDFCTEDASCDSNSPGKCGPLAWEFAPPLTTADFCTQPIFVTVPLKPLGGGLYKKGVGKMALKVQPPNDPITDAPRPIDADKIKFTCNP